MMTHVIEGLVEHFVLVDQKGVTVQFSHGFYYHIYEFFPVLFPDIQPACCAYCKWHLYEPHYRLEMRCVRVLKHAPEMLQKVLSLTHRKDMYVSAAFGMGDAVRENFHCGEFERASCWPFDLVSTRN